MKRLITLTAALCIGLAGLSLVACESDNSNNLPPGENGATAGGNGAFGENPGQPGDYSNRSIDTNHNSNDTR